MVEQAAWDLALDTVLNDHDIDYFYGGDLLPLLAVEKETAANSGLTVSSLVPPEVLLQGQTFAERVNGSYFPTSGLIYLNPDRPVNYQAYTMLHEFMHHMDMLEWEERYGAEDWLSVYYPQRQRSDTIAEIGAYLNFFWMDNIPKRDAAAMFVHAMFHYHTGPGVASLLWGEGARLAHKLKVGLDGRRLPKMQRRLLWEARRGL